MEASSLSSNCETLDAYSPSKKRKSYSAAEKLKILEFAETHGNRMAARKYGVCESNVRDWRKKKCVLQAMSPSKRAQRGRISRKVKQSTNGETEEQVHQHQQHQSLAVTTNIVQCINVKEESSDQEVTMQSHETNNDCALCALKDTAIKALKSELSSLKRRVKLLETENHFFRNSDIQLSLPERNGEEDESAMRDRILAPDDEQAIFKHRI